MHIPAYLLVRKLFRFLFEKTHFNDGDILELKEVDAWGTKGR